MAVSVDDNVVNHSLLTEQTGWRKLDSEVVRDPNERVARPAEKILLQVGKRRIAWVSAQQ